MRRLRERLEDKTALFAATVHDLKTPLLGIRQLSALVLDDDTLSEDGRRKLELIRATADEAMGRVDHLLSATADEGEEMLGWGPVNVETLVEDVVHRLQPHAEYKGQTLRYDRPEPSCRVEGDELRLQEAVRNLVSNALKYSPEGETIDVEVTCAPESVRISVADNGPGLSGADQKRLFSPFQRLTPQPTGNERSSGVGLYITKQVMNLHGGDVDVVTAEGEGSTFTLVLPTMPSSRLRRADSGAPPAVTTPEQNPFS
jgi:signal transduction histidine kinase